MYGVRSDAVHFAVQSAPTGIGSLGVAEGEGGSESVAEMERERERVRRVVERSFMVRW